MNKTFQSVGANRPGRSVFDLSYTHLTTGDLGYLYPVMIKQMVPGDVFDLSVDLVIRFQPLVAPILHEINAYLHTFFVPNRILWDDWESFITRGAEGDEEPTLPVSGGPIPAKSLGDYLGFPTALTLTGITPVRFPRYAYNMIYNEFYRDQTHIAEVDANDNTILRRSWGKDYFTSAMPWQQRGTAPALPISGTIAVDPAGDSNPVFDIPSQNGATLYAAAASGGLANLQLSNAGTSAAGSATWNDPKLEVDLSSAVTFDISDLRLAFQTQRWLERNARSGARYTEFLNSHFGVSPRDDRLDRPEYIGGIKSPVIISEVLQTSETGTTPQGEMTGHGITVARDRIGKYRAEEFGIVMTILSVMPEQMYQQGVDREWIKETVYDYYFPEFAHLSEQPIYNGELWVTDGNGTVNSAVFGYQERYAEMRSSKNIVTGGMRATFDYWHLSTQYSSLPTLGQTFLEYPIRDDCFAAPAEDHMIIHVGNKIRAIRPMPVHSDPGLIDH